MVETKCKLYTYVNYVVNLLKPMGDKKLNPTLRVGIIPTLN